jgi:hypothetical protein
MSKNITEWFDLLEAEKQNMPELAQLQPSIDSSQQLLSELSSTSKVAEHRLWMWLTAVAAWLLETLFDRHKKEVESIIDRRQFGTIPWFREISLAYQHGDTLVWINNRYLYASDVAASRIIKYAAADNSVQSVLLKVAKQVSGSPAKLSAIELAAFEAYIKLVQPPGVSVQVYSTDADLMQIELDVYYDALLMSSDGTLITDNTKPVEIALQGYLNNIEFNGRLDLVSLVDSLQAAPGVMKPYVVLCNAKSASASVWTPVSRQYISAAGYLAIDLLTINYIAYV